MCLLIHQLLNGGKRTAFQGFEEIVVDRYHEFQRRLGFERGFGCPIGTLWCVYTGPQLLGLGVEAAAWLEFLHLAIQLPPSDH